MMDINDFNISLEELEEIGCASDNNNWLLAIHKALHTGYVKGYYKGYKDGVNKTTEHYREIEIEQGEYE